LFPLFVHTLIVSNYQKIGTPEFDEKYGTLIESIRVDKEKGSLIFLQPTVFLYRRLFLVLTVIFLHNIPYMQSFCILAQSAFCIFWMFKVSPFENSFTNKLRIVDEVILLFACIFVQPFIFQTEMSDDNTLLIGWILIALPALSLTLNLTVVIIDMVKSLISLIRSIPKLCNKNKTMPENYEEPNDVTIDDSQTMTADYMRAHNDSGFNSPTRSRDSNLPTGFNTPTLSRNVSRLRLTVNDIHDFEVENQ